VKDCTVKYGYTEAVWVLQDLGVIVSHLVQISLCVLRLAINITVLSAKLDNLIKDLKPIQGLLSSLSGDFTLSIVQL
jgi:hypothetical protein